MTTRYSGSVDSTTATDHGAMTGWLEGNKSEPEFLSEARNQVQELKLENEVKRGTSLYNGIFNLLVRNGARDWATGNVQQGDDLDDHHIVPLSRAKDYSGNKINSILNRAPLSAHTNRVIISDRLPNEYLPDWIEGSGEDKVREVLRTHIIPDEAIDILLRDPFGEEDFDEFISVRERSLKRAIHALLSEDGQTMSSDLSKLDSEVGAIELSLRELISSKLEGDPQLLPRHIYDNTKSLIDRVLKRDASVDPAHFENLNGFLEFTDIRGLQDVITGRNLWAEFESTFGNKETLFTKFGQLAELRNAIAHNRTINEIAQMEGEASVKWFSKVLNK